MSRRTHWERVYSAKSADQLSWYQARPTLSIELIASTGAGPDARIIDVGGGDSLLVDHLLDSGFRNITVLDVSPLALQRAKVRLGERAASVSWVVEDATHWVPSEPYDLWHDRAVFHFLTDAGDRAAYLKALRRALAADGHAVMATFGLKAPPKCSGLDVVRYSPESLALELGEPFRLVESRDQLHVTPGGVEQAFVHCRFVRDSGGWRVKSEE